MPLPHHAPALRIAHVIAPAPFGGLESVVAGLTRSLVADGTEVTLLAIVPPDGVMPEFLTPLARDGVGVVPLRFGARDYARERRALLEALRDRRVELVHTHGYRCDVISGGAARRAGHPTISTVHGFTRQGWRGRAYEWLQVRALRRFDAVVAVSEVLGRELVARGVPGDRVEVIPNGLVGGNGLVDRARARAILGLTAPGPVIGWVGRLSPEKAPQLAVRALAAMKRTDVQLCVVGEGPLGDECRALAGELGVGARVRFAGPVPEAATLFAAFDALALSSRTEGTPMVVLEAIRARVPVVATAVGGVPALLGEGHPGLVHSAQPADLASALDRSFDDPARAAAAALALSTPDADEASSRWVERYRSVYRRLRRDVSARR